ncbi:hypothetical protein, partial [Parasphingopyxis sp.]|uniref:hypothetical protein n=1 Tax=Parasphingopyxis sp. TaxID=1920299 RepID=UPI003FA0850D
MTVEDPGTLFAARRQCLERTGLAVEEKARRRVIGPQAKANGRTPCRSASASPSPHPSHPAPVVLSDRRAISGHRPSAPSP